MAAIVRHSLVGWVPSPCNSHHRASSSSFGGGVAPFDVKDESSPPPRAVWVIIAGMGRRNTLYFTWRLSARLCRDADLAHHGSCRLVCSMHAIFLRTRILHFVKQFLHRVDGLLGHPLCHRAHSKPHLAALMMVLSVTPFSWHLTSANLLKKLCRDSFSPCLMVNICLSSFGSV